MKPSIVYMCTLLVILYLIIAISSPSVEGGPLKKIKKVGRFVHKNKSKIKIAAGAGLIAAAAVSKKKKIVPLPIPVPIP